MFLRLPPNLKGWSSRNMFHRVLHRIKEEIIIAATLLTQDKTVALNCANRLQSIKAEHEGNIAKMKALMLELDAVWKGDSETAYNECFMSMTSTFNKYSQLLEDYSATLTRVTNNTFNNDSQHASEIYASFKA